MHNVAIKITNATKKVLDVLQEGRATPGYIQRETDLARNTVHGQINQLLAADAVVYVDEPTGLYELVDDPRDGTEEGSLASPEDVRQERDAYESDLEEAGGEINALVEEVETLQDQLAAAPDRGEIEAAIEDLEAACEQGDRNGVDVALDRLREAAMIDDGE